MNKDTLFIHDRFIFDVNGFVAKYSYKGRTTTLTLCPAAFCDLLAEAKQIEDFTLDGNGEPVILYTCNIFPQGYGFEHWCAFVRFFPISYRMAVALLQYREDRNAHHRFQVVVNNLLSPLQVA